MIQAIKIPVHMTPSVFRRFANFDMFRFRKYYRNPLYFMLGLCALGVVCLVLRDKEQSALLGGVLIGLGVLLPAVYVAVYEHSLSRQIREKRLKEKPLVYTLTLSGQEAGVEILGTHGEAPVRLKWKQLHSAHRAKDAFYLYATAAKAFILPLADIPMAADEFEAFLCERLPGRVTGRRKR